MKIRHSIRFLLAALACTLGTAYADDPATTDSTSQLPLLGKYRITYYYIILESNYANDIQDATIQTMDDQVIESVSSRFKKALDIEGTGMLIDGRVVNFAGRKAGDNRYVITQSAYGDGVGTCQLVPYHTIAVDPNTIPLGSLVQIDETIGMVLPDGSIHDGTWRAEDVGGAIKGDRIDLFMGGGTERSTGAILEGHGIQNMQALTVRTLQPSQPGNCTGHDPVQLDLRQQIFRLLNF